MNDQLLRDLSGAVRELNSTLSGVLRANAGDAERASSYYAGFNETFTGTGTIVVWTPSLGARYKVKGISIICGVDETLAAAKPVVFYLADGTSENVVAPITIAPATAAAGSVYPTTGAPIYIDLREGCIGTLANTTLVIRANRTIGAGVARFCGTVFGEEIPA